MAHPSNLIPNQTHIIDVAAVDLQATPYNGDSSLDNYFHTISCSVGGTVNVTGGSVFVYVDVSESTSDFEKFIDPATGKIFISNAVMDAYGDGFFQSIDTEARALVMGVGQTVYGKFTSVKSDGTFAGFAYS